MNVDFLNFVTEMLQVREKEIKVSGRKPTTEEIVIFRLFTIADNFEDLYEYLLEQKATVVKKKEIAEALNCEVGDVLSKSEDIYTDLIKKVVELNNKVNKVGNDNGME